MATPPTHTHGRRIVRVVPCDATAAAQLDRITDLTLALTEGIRQIAQDRVQRLADEDDEAYARRQHHARLTTLSRRDAIRAEVRALAWGLGLVRADDSEGA